MLEQLIARAENNQEIVGFINNQVAARLKKYPETTLGEVEHIIDFLHSDQAPKKLRRAAYVDMVRKAEDWVKALKKRGLDVVETEEDVEVEKTWDTGMRLVKLRSKAAYQREGSLMSHCVASYYDRDCVIFSLRDAKNIPHATIELVRNAGRVEQVKGRGNGEIHPKYIKYVMETLKHFDVEVRPSELTYMGYVALTPTLWEMLDRDFEGVKYMSFGGERYFYKGSKVRKGASHAGTK